MLQLTLKLLLLLFSTLRLSSCQSLNADSSEHFIFILVISHDLDFDGQLNEQWNRDFDNRAIAAEEANLNEYTSAVSPCFSGSTILKFYALPNNYPGSAYVARLAFSCEETLSGIEHGLQPIDVVSVSESDFGISSGSDTDTIKEV
uniref:Uncharacterized protein n=1 Tax=Plectus sambesii TaxID=2011161 RepID=A0A914ULN0_9BILA